VVERNGNFWVENLPLAAGANTLTLTATDANNNVTSITSTVVQSSVILTIAPASDITCQTAVDVSGTINSTGYSVWVNGLETTALNPCGDGVWSWTVQNVPVNGTGTAVFQAEAIATGGSCTGGGGGTNSSLQNPGNPFSAQCACVTEFCPDKQPVIVCTAYHQQSTTVCDLPVGAPSGVSYNMTWTQNWSEGVGGDQFWTSSIFRNDGGIPYENGNPDGGFSWQCWRVDATGNGIQSNGASWVNNNYTDNVSTSSWLYGIYLSSWNSGRAAEYEGGNAESLSPSPGYDDGDVTDYYMQALAYVPGGKAVPGLYVVQFTCNASGAPSADWIDTIEGVGRADQSWTTIPYQDITMAGGTLDTNGYYNEVVSSGSLPIDITPSFDGGPGANNLNSALTLASGGQSYYTFTVGAKKLRTIVVLIAAEPDPLTNTDGALDNADQDIRLNQKEYGWIVLKVDSIQDANTKLKGIASIDELDIVGHGSPGYQGVGNNQNEALQLANNGTVSGLGLFEGVTFSASGVIILRGCKTAAGTTANPNAGKQFLQAIANATVRTTEGYTGATTSTLTTYQGLPADGFGRAPEVTVKPQKQ
jgi:hypothetical protein